MKEYDRATGRCLVEVSEDFYRPTDVVNLWGDPTKVRAKLRWNPNTIMFEELARIMEEADVAKVAAENAAQYVCTNLAEHLKKGFVKSLCGRIKGRYVREAICTASIKIISL